MCNLIPDELLLLKDGILILSQNRTKTFNPRQYDLQRSHLLRIGDTDDHYIPLDYENTFTTTKKITFVDHNMSQTQSEEILEFFKGVKEDTLIIHCMMGSCRSSAIAAAYCNIKNKKDSHDSIWASEKYSPNAYLYATLVRNNHHTQLHPNP
jgi:predicted protein tyrosine phosphatase